MSEVQNLIPDDAFDEPAPGEGNLVITPEMRQLFVRDGDASFVDQITALADAKAGRMHFWPTYSWISTGKMSEQVDRLTGAGFKNLDEAQFKAEEGRMIMAAAVQHAVNDELVSPIFARVTTGFIVLEDDGVTVNWTPTHGADEKYRLQEGVTYLIKD